MTLARLITNQGQFTMLQSYFLYKKISYKTNFQSKNSQMLLYLFENIAAIKSK